MKNLPTASDRKRSRLKRFHWRGNAAARFLASLAVAGMAATSAAHATPYTDAGGTSLFSTAFSPLIPGAGTTTADTLTFSNTAVSTQTDDLTQALNANILTFSNTAALILNQGVGTTIALGGTTPVVNLSNTALVTDNLNLSLAANTTFNGNGSLTMGGTIGGAGFTLTKNGTGTLTLAGNGTSTLGSSSTGGTILNLANGTTTFGIAGTDAPTLSIAGNNTGVFLTGGNLNVANGTITDTDSQGLVIAGSQTYTQTGGVFTNTGRIEFSNNGGASTVNISGGTLSTTLSTGIETVRGTTTINLSGTGAITAPLLDMTTTQLSGGAAGTTFNLNGGTLTTGQIIPGNNGTTGSGTIFNFNGGTLTSSATSATFMTGLTTANVRAGGAIINTGTFSDTIGQNLLNGTGGGTDGGLTKQGTGTLTLSGANTYTGATTVNAGTLKAGSTAAFGSNSAVTLANAAGATLDTTGFNNSIGSLTGGGATGGNVTLGAATLTVGGDNTSPASYAGIISGTGGGLTKTGTGTLTLSGANAYTGATTVNAGTLKAGSTAAFGSNSAVTLANAAGATLDTTGFNNSIGSLTGGGATGGNVTLGAATLTVGGDNTSPASYAGTFSGTGIIAKVGTGTTIIGGSGTSTAGQIRVDNNGALTFGSATESPTLTLSGSGLLINSNGNSNTPAFNVAAGTLGLGSSNGAFTLNTGSYNQTGGAVTVTGSGICYVANGSSTFTSVFNLSGGTFTAASGSAGYFYNAVRGTSTVNLNGTGTLTAPSFGMLYGSSGVSNTANSTLNLGNGTSGGTLVVNAVVANVNGASTGTSTFNFNGGTLQASASSTTFMTGLTTANIRNGGAVINTNGFNDTIGQALIHSTVGGDNTTDGGLTKQGAGTLTLTGANTYTGATTVSAGALAVNGSTAAASTVTVASAGTLTGTGVVGGAVTDSGTVNAGGVGTVGSLTTGADTFNPASSLVFDFGNNTIDEIFSTGLVSGLSSAAFSFTQLTGSTGLVNPSYTLVSAAGGFSDTTLPTSVTGTPSGYQLQYSGNNLNLVQVAAAPEPSQWAAFGIGLLGLGALSLKARRRLA